MNIAANRIENRMNLKQDTSRLLKLLALYRFLGLGKCMKLPLMTLLLIALAFAQFGDFDRQISDCQRSCCSQAGGAWDDGTVDCDASKSGNAEGYGWCSNTCLEEASGSLGGAGLDTGNLCCPPGLVLFSLIGFAVLRK
jgi:hypothetical protein